MAGYRPNCPVIAVVTSDRVCGRLALNWGVTAISGEEKCSSDEITRQALKKAEETGNRKKRGSRHYYFLQQSESLPVVPIRSIFASYDIILL